MAIRYMKIRNCMCGRVMNHIGANFYKCADCDIVGILIYTPKIEDEYLEYYKKV